ncbi:RNA polymerase sigma factor [Winogradskyella sp.]|nr:RNA polymerase sigma factor [Winogradskyella sp.]
MHNKNRDNEDVWVTRLQNGDKKALVFLVKKWHKLFCNTSYWMVKDKDAAKDIVQESWLVIIDKIDGLKKPKQFKYWAYRIVCNKFTDWLRLKLKEQQIQIRDSDNIRDDSVCYSENEKIKSKLLNAVNRLPNHQKEVVRLFYIEAYSLKEISSLLKISLGTTKSRLFNAREKLKIIIKQTDYEN